MKKADDQLNLWVFGPGVGEFIVVHVPPDGWLAIDGCSAGGELFPPRFFEQQAVAPTHVLMTHPHLDHARGVQELVERHTAPQLARWPRLGLLLPPRRKGVGADPQAVYEGRVANGVLSSMTTRWRRRPQCHWDPIAGSTESIGAGELRVLSPEPTVASGPRGPRFDWNRLATALTVEWAGQRVILGSDLVETPGKGWTHVLARTQVAREHLVLKVAHHGSVEAQHPPLLERLAGETEVVLVGTPFSSQELPRFGRYEGADVLLRHSSKLYLTGLPQRFETQNRTPRQWKRSRLHKIRKPISPDEVVAPFPSCFVHLVVSGTGKSKINYGPGSVVVHAG